MNVAEFLHRAARAYGSSLALQHTATRWSYGELDELVGRLAAALLAGDLQPGDRVAIWAPNSPEFVQSLFAIFSAGLVAVPINARLQPGEVDVILKDSVARALIFDPSLGAPSDHRRGGVKGSRWLIPVNALPVNSIGMSPVDRDPSDLAWLFYTSGTTGHPKGAMLTHGNLVAQAINCLADIYSFQPEDVVLHAAPLSHGSGMYLLPSIARGARNVILHGSFRPSEVFGIISELGVTAIAFMAPTQIVALLQSPEARQADLRTLRAVIYGGGPMYVKHIRAALDLWGPIFVQLFGQGESPMTGTYLRREAHLGDDPDQSRRLASIGIPRTDIELRIVDELDQPVEPGHTGEISLRGPTVMKGYWKNRQATVAALRNGWLHTGDVGYEDPDGYVHLVDRLKDMIISGGNNVYAREVEDVILTHPAVAEVAVIGRPDDYWGEAVHAVVVLQSSATATPEDIIDHCRSRMAGYKRPKSVEFVHELPKNAYGKVLKRNLRVR